ncbi:MAG: 2-oxo acid dehydrogenase subunit E2, partial [Bacteroidetes bacterium]|nr:2-oxo acid dehydrogenase subunit E2 [Bacteroidota bacterium]
MAIFEVVMPKLGESIIEATITRWLKKEGDRIAEDDAIVEIATDKVDSEIPSPVEGKITKVHFIEGEVVPVGAVIALIEMDGGGADEASVSETEVKPPAMSKEKEWIAMKPEIKEKPASERFYSPLVKIIAKTENISLMELDSITGTGKEGRVTKNDLLNYLESRRSGNF